MPTILIVDDDAALRDSVAETLTDLGYHTIAAADGASALEAASRERIDAALLDLRIPGMDGLEILQRLRASPRGAPPVAILTAYASATNTIEAMRLGAFDHLTKPIAREELASLVSRMLRSRQGSARPASPNLVEDDLVGPSDAMRAVQKTIGLVADTDATVLIAGETEPARNSSLPPFTATGVGLPGRSSPSTAPPFPPSFWRASYSAMCEALSPVRSRSAAARSAMRIVERCFSTRSATWIRRCRRRS
jgi:CheY-like chemotaxis protein